MYYRISRRIIQLNPKSILNLKKRKEITSIRRKIWLLRDMLVVPMTEIQL